MTAKYEVAQNLNRLAARWKLGKEKPKRTLDPFGARFALPAELREAKPGTEEPEV